MEAPACQVDGPASSNPSVVFVGVAFVMLPAESRTGSEPPTSSTRLEPANVPGRRTPEPKTRVVGEGMSSHDELFRTNGSCPIGECRNQESSTSGPATMIRPLGIQNRCG